MDDYISREAALDKLNMAYRLCTRYVECLPLELGIGCVKGLPAADVEPVRHGRWNRPYISWFFPLKIRNPYCFCTYCGHPIKPRKATDYCPNCGAKMDLEDENDENCNM